MAARPRPWPCCPAARPSTPAIALIPSGITTDQRGPAARQRPLDIGAFQSSPAFIVATADGQRQDWRRGPDTTFRIDVFDGRRLQRRRVRAGKDFLRPADGDQDAAAVGFAIPSPLGAGGTATHGHGDGFKGSDTVSATCQSVARNAPGQPVIFSSAAGDAIALQDPDAGPLDPVGT